MAPKEKIASKLKKGDLVEIITGRDKGKRGKITQMLRYENRALVEGIHMVTRHIPRSKTKAQGSMISKPMSIHLSNVAIIDPKMDKRTRIKMKAVETEGGKTTFVRVSKISGELLDL